MRIVRPFWLSFLVLLVAGLPGGQGVFAREPAASKAAAPLSASARSAAAQRSVLQRCHKLLKRRDKGEPPFRWQVGVPGKVRERCFPFQDGFFALTVRETTSWGGEGFPNSAAVWDVIWVRNGKVQVLDFNASSSIFTTINDGSPSLSSELADVHQTGDHSYQIDILRVQDLDGDGNAEIFIQQYTEAYEDLDSTNIDILSVRGKELVSYPHTPGVSISSLEDVDKDGLPDFYTAGAYQGYTMPVCGGIDTEPAVPAVFLLHTLPKGAYSETDAVAQAALKEWCPQRPDLAALAMEAVAQKTSKPYSLSDGFAKVVVCARAWGASAAAVMAGIKPACPIAPNGCEYETKPKSKECPAWVAELAAVTPTVLLK